MRSSQAVVSRRAKVQQHYHRIKTSSKFPGNTGNRFLNCFNDLVTVETQRKIWCDAVVAESFLMKILGQIFVLFVSQLNIGKKLVSDLLQSRLVTVSQRKVKPSSLTSKPND